MGGPKRYYDIGAAAEFSARRACSIGTVSDQERNSFVRSRLCLLVYMFHFYKIEIYNKREDRGHSGARARDRQDTGRTQTGRGFLLLHLAQPSNLRLILCQTVASGHL